MATFTESADSRRFTENKTFEVRGKVVGTSSHSTAVTTAKAATAASEGLLIRDDVIAEPEYIDTTSEADCVWLVTVPYKLPSITPLPQSDIGDVTLSGNIMGAATNIQHSSATSPYYASTDNKPDFKGLINVGQDGHAEGVDVELPAFDFTVTKVWASGSLPSLATLYAIKKSPVNSDSFTVTDSITGMSITVAAGACLFRGVQFAGPRQDGAVEFTYQFSTSLNETNITVRGGAGNITVTSKKGWQYLWVYSESEEDSAAHKLVTRPVAAFVETVYASTAFAALGL